MRVFLSRLLGFVRGRRLDRDLDDEVALHLDLLTQEYVRRGMGPAEARAAAQHSFGGVMQMKESYREQRGLPGIEMFLQDARYGVRRLLRTKGFTAAALARSRSALAPTPPSSASSMPSCCGRSITRSRNGSY